MYLPTQAHEALAYWIDRIWQPVARLGMKRGQGLSLGVLSVYFFQ